MCVCIVSCSTSYQHYSCNNVATCSPFWHYADTGQQIAAGDWDTTNLAQPNNLGGTQPCLARLFAKLADVRCAEYNSFQFHALCHIPVFPDPMSEYTALLDSETPAAYVVYQDGVTGWERCQHACFS